MNSLPLAVTIAGSDAVGGAGIGADLRVFHAFNVHGASVITAVSAQGPPYTTSYLSPDILTAQLRAISQHQLIQSIKIGMVGKVDNLKALLFFLCNYKGFVVFDPVMQTSSGYALTDLSLLDYAEAIKIIFPYVDILTPNLHEAELIVKKSLFTHSDIETAASDILSLGVKNVLIKGGHFLADSAVCEDYWTNGKKSFWLVHKRYDSHHYRGTGCALSSALAATLAKNIPVDDALMMAKMYINRGIRLAYSTKKIMEDNHRFIHHEAFFQESCDLPHLFPTRKKIITRLPSFPDCGASSLGLYPIVDSSAWVERLLLLGIRTVQLRIKHGDKAIISAEIKKSITLANLYKARLFINDYWDLAIEYEAYGVHLGQEDLELADIEKIYRAGLRLGISTHSYHEIARAKALKPSYFAFGPIFHTFSKNMTFEPQGLEKLSEMRRLLLHEQLVAIGGINKNNIKEVHKIGVNGIALISAITKAKDLTAEIKQLQMTCG